MQFLLLFSAFVVATCGLIYELIAGTLASYLLGDSVTQFSTIIGVYLFSMGIGSFLSKNFNKNLLGWFIQIELLVGIVGGFSSVLLFVCFEYVESFRIILYFMISLTGILVGLEIPLLLRILKDQMEFKDLVSKIFTVDYIGALLASIIFPLILVPYLGLVKTSLFFGILNVLVALWLILKLKSGKGYFNLLLMEALLILVVLAIGMIYAEGWVNSSEQAFYHDKVIYAKSSPYQRIVLTKNKDVIKLHLNGNLQFSSADEYRYHEALVHPGMSLLTKPENILVLGGGDGLAVRELLKYPEVKHIKLIDLDAQVTHLFKTHSLLTPLNQNSLSSPKLDVLNADAYTWLRNSDEKFDFVCVDFPDPSNFSIGKLYSAAFYKELKRVLKPNAVIVVQSTSPLVARKTFWCVNHTLQYNGFYTKPYHVYVPSFGEWGYVMASPAPLIESYDLKVPCRFLDSSALRTGFVFPKDMDSIATDVNKLNNQVLVHYFEEEWSNYIP
ncbi:MAG: polyamine aminopropyltransferase [Bacteroidetes bacterium]|nr:polyamine aminopropyltransferase [Bacteroidota bacterium]